MKKGTQAAMLLVFLLGFTLCAAADINQDLTINVSIEVRDTQCTPLCFEGSWVNSDWWVNNDNAPYPVTGFADFSSVAPPWAYSYDSGNPLTWRGSCSIDSCSYNADYYGFGTITVQGPDGLVFTGTYMAGNYSAFINCPFNTCYGYERADFSFKGMWSNGIVGYGSVSNSFYFVEGPNSNFTDNSANLMMFVAPEPASLALLATGIAGLWTQKKRLLD